MPSSRLIPLLILILSDLFQCQDLGHRRDPTAIIYPGQVNIGIIANVHEAPAANSSAACGKLRQGAVQKVMAAVWAAHQVNFMKDDVQDLNIGVYIFDTCGREDVAQRQVYRLLGYVGHVQTIACSDKRIPPLFAVITEGDMSSLKMPLEFLESFGVPVISTTELSTSSNSNHYLTTAPTTNALARAAVTILKQLQLFEVAVIAEDNSAINLFHEFSKEAQVSGMQALPVDHPSIVGDPDNFLASLQVVSEYGRSRLKAVVFLVNSEQALDLLRSVDANNFPQMPWVIITETDLSPILLKSFKRHQLRRLQQVLLLSPEATMIPEFQEYFKQLLQEDTIKYHPLLVEFAKSVADRSDNDDPSLHQGTSAPRKLKNRRLQSNANMTTPSLNSSSIAEVTKTTVTPPSNSEQPSSSYEETDVSSMVKAIWTFAASLKTVQRRSCRRGTDCLLYLRRSLSSYVLKAAKSLDYNLDSNSGSTNLQGTRLSFSGTGVLNSVRFSLKGFTYRGDIQEVGWYSDDVGLAIDHDVISPFNGFVFKDTETPTQAPTPTPEMPVQPEFHAERMSLHTTDAQLNESLINSNEKDRVNDELPEDVPNTLPLADKERSSWKILDDISRESVTTVDSLTSMNDLHLTPNAFDDALLLENENSDENNHVYEDTIHVQPLHENSTDDEFDIVVGPSYRAESHLPSSNLRSVSLTSHHEPLSSNAFRSPKRDEDKPTNLRPALARSVDQPSARLNPSLTSEDVKVVSASQNLHISAWLARPWALAVLGLCGFGVLVTMYVLVFLMVKACEGSLKKTNTSVAITQLISLLCLYIAAALYTWKPSAAQCGLKRLVPNISYAFCFGCLLLKGMYLKAQNSLGLGGSVNKCNQLMTLLFIVGVQVALEIQWWFIRPPSISLDTLECSTIKEELMESQGYVSFLLLLSVIMALSTRKIPYNCQEVRSLMGTSVTCLIVFLAWDVACWILPDSKSRDIAAPSALIVTAIVVLIGIFGPQLFAIHKYGGFPHKPLSYADSLSTVFTMFKDLDNTSNSGTTGRGKKTAKTLETPFGNEVGESTRNPLYTDYQSAYP